MTKFRFHRGSLKESMTTVVEIGGLLDLIAELQNAGWPPGNVAVKRYVFDDRINWDTHIVTLDDVAVGFTDGPISGEAG